MTRVISIGGNLASKPERLYIVIPGKRKDNYITRVKEEVRRYTFTGNPGVSSFYEDFIESLFHRMGKKGPVWVVGHAGHDVKDHESEIPYRKGKLSRSNLAHKLL